MQYFWLRLCASLGLLDCPLVRPLVRHAWVENAKNAHSCCCSWYCACASVLEGGGVGVRLGVGCLCPPIRNDIVTPLQLFNNQFLIPTCGLYQTGEKLCHLKIVLVVLRIHSDWWMDWWQTDQRVPATRIGHLISKTLIRVTYESLI